MKNRLAFLLSSMIKWVRTKLPPLTTPALSPEEFRKMLAEQAAEKRTKEVNFGRFCSKVRF